MLLVSHHALKLEHLWVCFNLCSKICPEVKVIVILNLDKLLSNSLSPSLWSLMDVYHVEARGLFCCQCFKAEDSFCCKTEDRFCK